MGVMTYLLVVSGLIVFAKDGDPKTPELLWILAFAGAYSDTWAVGLLEKLLGEFRKGDRDVPGLADTKKKPEERDAQEDESQGEE